jgi:hypothetical protein
MKFIGGSEKYVKCERVSWPNGFIKHWNRGCLYLCLFTFLHIYIYTFIFALPFFLHLRPYCINI